VQPPEIFSGIAPQTARSRTIRVTATDDVFVAS
jgi:hypothetical protein